jgi:hypothetical protein
MTDSKAVATASQGLTVKAFFEGVPPGKSESVECLGIAVRGHGLSWEMQIPTIQLHCNNEACSGIRFFEPTDTKNLRPGEQREHFITFVCRNCKHTRKTYAIWSRLNRDDMNGELMKFGEFPPFGPPTPARVIAIIGGERDYFLKGRRAENQGLGIAAFAYYRRVVENQKTRIIEEVIRVAQKIGAAKVVIDDLNAARDETQFSRAVEAIKHGVPESLLIGGHNPLSLLHSALSEGLHAQTDQQCLELATSIRVVLTELVERMSIALKEELELNTAVSKLLQVSAQKAERSGNVG